MFDSMENLFSDYFTAEFYQGVTNFLFALIYLIVGWIIAKVIGNLVKSGLEKTKIDEKVLGKFGKGDSEEKPVNTAELAGKVVYFFLLIIVFSIFFSRLNLNVLSTPLSNVVDTILGFVPAILKAVIILLIAYLIASALKWLIIKGTEKAKAHNFLTKAKLAETNEDVKAFFNTLGTVVFYLTLLLFIPAILDALNISGMSEPFTGMLDSMLAFIPKLLAAGLIFGIGWFVAKILKGIVANLLDALGVNKVIEKLKLQKLFEGTSFGKFVGNIVFVVILIPVTIAALERLELRGISEPAISMLSEIMVMIPNILIAIALVLVGVWLGKLVGEFVHGYLSQLGFDRLAGKMSVGNVDVTEGKLTPSAVVGYVVQTLIVFFLAVQALYLIKFDFLVNIAMAITAYLPNVLAAVLIIGVALILANIVHKVLVNLLVGPASNLLAGIAKYAIIALAALMALTQLGIATTIVTSAFVLILGGVALAFGLAFGLGGKDFASKYLKKFEHTIDETSIKDE